MIRETNLKIILKIILIIKNF